MGKRHIAVFTPFVGGHVYPALALCSELARRGHHITYPTNGSYSSKVREAGATALEFKAPEVKYVEKIFDRSTSDDRRFWRMFSAVMGPMLIATAVAIVEEFEEIYAQDPPDLIIYDWFAFAGRILAGRLSCPAMQVHSHFAHRHDSLMRLDGACTTPEPMLAFATLVDSVMATYGLEEQGQLWSYESHNLFLIPREFQYDSDMFDGRFRFVGTTHNRKPRSGVWKKQTEAGIPLLLISEATSSTEGEFLRLCVEAFAGTKYHVVISKALNTPEIPPASLPQNVEINREAFNCEILPFANVTVCEGGMGTTLESLHHGVPVVSVPTNPFNAEVAGRLSELGLGLHIHQSEMTASTLRAAVDRVCSDEDLQRRVRVMQRTLASTPGAEGGADFIEEYLATF